MIKSPTRPALTSRAALASLAFAGLALAACSSASKSAGPDDDEPVDAAASSTAGSSGRTDAGGRAGTAGGGMGGGGAGGGAAGGGGSGGGGTGGGGAAGTGTDGGTGAAGRAGADGGAVDAGGTAGGRLFVFAMHGKTIQPYKVDRATGALSTNGDAVAACDSPIVLRVDRAQRFLYAGCNNANGIQVFPIDKATGRLGAGKSAGGAGTVVGLGVHPSGKFALTANYSQSNGTLFRIDDAGKPEKVKDYGAGAAAHGAAFAGNGLAAFIANRNGSSVTHYAFDEAKGDPMSAGATKGGVTQARYLTSNKEGTFLYVVSERPPSAFVLKIAADGNLSDVNSTPLLENLDNDPFGKDIVVSPSGKFVYACAGKNGGKNGTITLLEIGATGGVTRKAIVDSAGTTPNQLAMDPDGQLLLAAHQGSGVVVYRLDQTTGMPTPVQNKKTPNSDGIAVASFGK